MGGAEGQKSRLPATRNVYTSRGCEIVDTRIKSSTNRNSVLADQYQQTGLLWGRHDTFQTISETRTLVLQKCVRIIRGIFNIQACNPIQVVPANAILTLKAFYEIFNDPHMTLAEAAYNKEVRHHKAKPYKLWFPCAHTCSLFQRTTASLEEWTSRRRVNNRSLVLSK